MNQQEAERCFALFCTAMTDLITEMYPGSMKSCIDVIRTFVIRQMVFINIMYVYIYTLIKTPGH